MIARVGGAVVMSSGIVSVGLSLAHHELLSRVLLVAAAAGLAAVAAALAGLAVSDRATLLSIARDPGALTWVAATDVVGSRLSILGWQHEAAALLAVATAVWLVLVPLVLRHWRAPTAGVSFLLVVATESLSVLAARLGLDREALVPLALGLVFYVIVLARFELRELLVGRGDQWIAGGALAIAALACARCAQRVAGLHVAALVVWCAAAAWLPVLVGCEALRRGRRFDERRWSTVFPLGMYAVCSFAVGDVLHVRALSEFALAWVWVALAAWALVATLSLRAAA